MGDWTILQGVGTGGSWGLSQGGLGADGSGEVVFLGGVDIFLTTYLINGLFACRFFIITTLNM